jgi:NADH-quinone oxidoreductase subunit C
MSKKVIEVVKRTHPTWVEQSSDFRGDDTMIVSPSHWRGVAATLKEHPELRMNQFVDLTAVDYPERIGTLPRFDVILIVRSLTTGYRVLVKTRVAEGAELDTLSDVWRGANWAEREVFDMFGIRFAGHPDMRRILLYDQFQGHPLRKDYPIQQTQPLIPYRQVDGIEKIAPFGADEGMPWSRVDWGARLGGEWAQVSPAIGLQQGERRALSESSEQSAESSATPTVKTPSASSDGQAPTPS